MSKRVQSAFLATVLITHATVPTNHAFAGLSAAEIGEQERYEEFRKRADAMRIKIEKDYDKSITIVLPDDIQNLPGYTTTTDLDGNRLVMPSGDSLYRDCIGNVKANLVFEAGGSGSLLGAAAAYGSSLLATQQCITDHRERLLDALNSLAIDRDISGIKVGIFNLEQSQAKLDVKVDFQDLKIDGLAEQLASLEQLFNGKFSDEFKKNMEKFATKEDIERIIDEKISVFRERVEKYLKQSEQEQMDAAQKKAAIEDIAHLATGLEFLADIALRDDPSGRAAMKNAIGGFAKMAQIAILMSSASGVPLFLLALSAAGTMNSMMNSMGRVGPSFEQRLLQEVSALKATLEKTRTEMHERFDQMVRMLDALGKFMQGRFDNLDARAKAILEILKSFREEAEIRTKIEQASLQILLQQPFKSSMQKCLLGQSAADLPEDAYNTCLGEFKLYSTDIAKADLINGGARVAEDPFGGVGQQLYFTLDGNETLGYLVSLFERISFKGIVNTAGPAEWARGVDAYLALLAAFPEGKYKSTKKVLIQNEQQNILAMVREGERIKLAARQIRSEGVVEILRALSREYSQLQKEITTKSVELLSNQNPGNIVETSWRESRIEQVNGHSSVFRGCSVLRVAKIIDTGGAKGQKVEYRSGEVCTGPNFTNKDNDAASKEEVQKAGMHVPETVYPMTTTKDPLEAQRELALKVIETDLLKDWPELGKTLLTSSVLSALDSPDLQKTFSRYAFAKHLAIQAVIVGDAGEVNDDTRILIEAIASLPDNAAAFKALVATARFSGEKKVSEAISEELGTKFQAPLSAAVSLAEKRFVTDEFPFIDRSLRRTQLLVLQK